MYEPIEKEEIKLTKKNPKVFVNLALSHSDILLKSLNSILISYQSGEQFNFYLERNFIWRNGSDIRRKYKFSQNNSKECAFYSIYVI